MPLQLSYDFIEYLYYLVMNRPVEYCGNLALYSSGIKSVGPIWEGSNENGRGLCIFKDKTDWIFHTHPYTSKSYPSFEDIITIAANDYDKRKASVIATYWGIWTILKGKETIVDRKDKDKKSEYNELSKLLHAHTKPREEILRSNSYDKEVEDAIHRFVSGINENFATYCTIDFVPWHIYEREKLLLEIQYAEALEKAKYIGSIVQKNKENMQMIGSKKTKKKKSLKKHKHKKNKKK